MSKRTKRIPKLIDKKEATENIQYSGEVTVKVLQGDKVVKEVTTHNEGTSYLFEYLVYCLTGRYESSRAPKWLMACNNGENALVETVLMVDDITYEKSSASCSATLSFLIPYSYIKPGITSIDSCKLYSTLNRKLLSNYSASINLNESIEFNQGDNLLIAWKMTIGN